MTGIKLYEATEALAIIDGFLEESGGELTPEIEALLAEAEGTFAEKVERVALKVRELEGAAEIVKGEKAKLAARQSAYENSAKGLKRYLERCLDAAGKDKVPGTLATVAMQSNAPTVVTDPDLDESDLRELFEAGASFVTLVPLVPETFALDKKAVLELVRSLGGLEGQDAVLPATIRVVQTRSLRIR